MEQLLNKSFYTVNEAEKILYRLCYDGTPEEITNFLAQESVRFAVENIDTYKMKSNIEFLLESGKYKSLDALLNCEALATDKKFFYLDAVLQTIESKNLEGLQYLLETEVYTKSLKTIISAQSITLGALKENSFDKDILGYLVNKHNLEKEEFFQRCAAKIEVFPELYAQVQEVLNNKKIQEEQQSLLHKIGKVGPVKAKNNLNASKNKI